MLFRSTGGWLLWTRQPPGEKQKGKTVTVKVRTKQKGNGGHSKHHAQSDVRKEKGNGGHYLDKQKGKANKSKWEGNAEGVEHTLQTKKKGTGEAKRIWKTL